MIWLHFDGRPDWLQRIKTLKHVMYTRTHGRWYVPYDLAALNAFVALQIPYVLSGARASAQEAVKDIPESGRDSPSIILDEEDDLRRPSAGMEGQDIQESIRLSWTAHGMYVQMPYRLEEVSFMKGLSGAYWHPKYQNWVCKTCVLNLDKIQQRWSVLTEEDYRSWRDKMMACTHPCKISLYRSPKHGGKIAIEIIGYGANHHLIKGISDVDYQKSEGVYLTSRSWADIRGVVDQYEQLGYQVVNRLVEVADPDKSSSRSREAKIRYIVDQLPADHYSALWRCANVMLRMHYGYQTIRTYLYQLSALMSHTQKYDLDQITVQEVQAYLEALSRSGASFSKVNQVHSAVQLYHKHVSADQTFALTRLVRPRKQMRLPSVLSEQEVFRMLSALSNIKHLCILYALYGGGMRRSEVLALKIEDILWDRHQVVIREGKGKKDRVIPLSDTLKGLLDGYFKAYKPAKYVFEGHEAGQPYSASSIRAIVKRAAQSAGISKRVTPHMLRHAFATHLLDHGISIAKIQALLGHKDIKTTLIYTHLTMDRIQDVQSPLDRMMHKKRNSDIKKLRI